MTHLAEDHGQENANDGAGALALSCEQLDECRKAMQIKIAKTARIRFEASDRLKRYESASQWSLTISTVLLIGLTLLDLAGPMLGPLHIPKVPLSFVQALLAIGLLALSLSLVIRDIH